MTWRFRSRFARLAGAAVVALISACVPQPASNYQMTGGVYQPPAAQAMEAPRALGLWKSNFGAVKLEEDVQRGGPGGGQLQGVWMYQRDGADVIGYFAGHIQGNVLQFTWQDQAVGAPISGEGYLVFDPSGQRFAGKWWTSNHDRVGEWNGWRQGGAAPTAPAPASDPYGQGAQPAPYGGAGYGGAGYGGIAYPPPTVYPNSY